LDGAIEGGEEEILADGESLVAFGEVAVDQGDQVDLLGQIEKGRDIAKSRNIDGLGLGSLVVVLLGSGGDEGLRGAEIEGPDDLRLAVDALALAGVVVGMAVNDLCREASHRRISRDEERAQLTVLGHT
jgi:hypothetical protein